MAEIIGTVASILQLVDTALKAREYIEDFRHAPEEQRTLLSEMESLSPLLKELQNCVKNNQTNNTLQQMHKPLTAFEETMKEFTEKLKSAGLLKNFVKRVQWTLWSKKESKEYLDKFEQFKTMLNGWLLLDVWDQQRIGRSDILKSVKDVADDQRRAHKQLMKTIGDVACDERRHLDAAQRREIIDWLSPINFFQRQADISSARQQETGGWILKHACFERWESESPGNLWCCGIPGAGKTVLASVVVEHLEARPKDENIGIACMYLNYREIDTQTVANLLASLWRQLVVGKDTSSLAKELYKKHSDKRTRPRVHELFDVLCSIIGEWSKVYIVVDALDEYPEDERNTLLGYLTTMGPTVSLMVTSRPHIDLGASLSSFETIDIHATDTDIRTYVRARIQQSSRLSMHARTRPELREEIERKIIGTVDGMFLLAKLHIDALATKSTVKAVREALENLPKDLERTYDEAMERIDRQNDEDKIAHSALTWVANAKRILSVAELREALAIEPGSKSLDPDSRHEIDLILSVCAGLVVVDEKSSVFNDTSPVVRLVHYTTQRYLDSSQDRRFPKAHTEITQALLTYLAFDSIFDRAYIDLDEYPLLDYCQYCLIHAVGRPEMVLNDLILSFLGQVVGWGSRMTMDMFWSTPPWDIVEQFFDVTSLWVAAAANLLGIAECLLDRGVSPGNAGNAPLCAASYYGHIQMMELLLERGADVNEADSPKATFWFRTALEAASSGGHKHAIRLLLKNGVEVNSSGALARASFRGHEGVVRLLLEFGADVNATDESHGSALVAASERGHYDTVRLLLEHGAGMNFKDGWGNNALQVASSAGHESVVRLLLKWGADANAVGGTYGSALGAASWGGHYDIVLFLLEQGVDLKQRSNALRGASFSGHEDVVRLLLERGADANANEADGTSALIKASTEGHDNIVRLLLEQGADINMKNQKYGNALQVASTWGHESVVRLLVQWRADANAVGGPFGSALVAASAQGHENIVRLLLEQGADVDLKDQESSNALQVASSWGRESALRFLLEWGADANAVGEPFGNGSALWAASLEGHDNIVRLLLEQGADMNMKNKVYGDALQIASSWGRESVVRLLLEWGADVNAMGGPFGSALMAASEKGHEKIVRLLLEQRADINAKSGTHGDALQVASSWGHESIVRLLLQWGTDANAVRGPFGGAIMAASEKGHDNIVRLLFEEARKRREIRSVLAP